MPRGGGRHGRALSARGLAEAAALLAAAGSLGSLATGVASRLGGPFWLELGAHLRLQQALGLAVAGALALAVGRRRLGIAGLALAVAVAATLAPELPVGAAAAPPGAPRLRLLVANVKTDNRDPRPLLRLAAEADPDVVALVEIDERWAGAVDAALGSYPHRLAVPRPDNFGVGVWSKRPLDGARVVDFGAGVPSIVAAVGAGERALTLVATHPLPPVSEAYARDRDLHLRALAAVAPGLGPATLVAGDLNATPWSPVLGELLDAGLADGRRGFGLQPTWPAALPWPLRIPIDHTLHGPGVVVVARRVGPDVGSDHLPLILDVALP